MNFPVFDIQSESDFENTAMEIYHWQRAHNGVYSKFCQLLDRPVHRFEDIPFLPISFFKSHQILTATNSNDQSAVFTSSGTTGMTVSHHYVSDIDVYHQSLDKSFENTYGKYDDYVVLALLPHYLERSGSSLVHMAQRWIDKSKETHSGFYLNELPELAEVLQSLQAQRKKVLLIGVTFALLQLAENHPQTLNNVTIIETGGMKGMRKEIIKQELHDILKKAFPEAQIQSEYGMTELLSQAYAPDARHFITPPWMKVSARDTNDPLTSISTGKTGGLNIIDLANYNSCSFIATQDLGKVYSDGSFEVLGRFDQSDIRGCNLMAIN